MLRNATENKSLIDAAIKDGELVAPTIVLDLVIEAMDTLENGSNNKKFVIDGYARSKGLIDLWAKNSVGSNCYNDTVLYFDSSVDTLRSNLNTRIIAGSNGRIDDTEGCVGKRLNAFTSNTVPVFDFYARCGKLRVLACDGLPLAVCIDKANPYFRAPKILSGGAYERTFAMIKPDAVSTQGAIAKILEMIKEANLNVIVNKLVTLDNAAAEEFYAEHKDKSFFPRLKQFMTQGPVLIMILEGCDAIRTWRALLGPTDTQKAQRDAPSSIRAQFGTDGTRNAAHGSDSQYSAAREIHFWMDPEQLGSKCKEALIQDIEEESSTLTSNNPPKIIIAGAPASGKGTQCEFIKAEYNCVHLSTGDMLRAAVKAGTPLGVEAKGHMDSGGLVPDKLIIDIIIARLAEQDCVERGWLLDGFPRTRAQADALAEAGLSCDSFILLDVPDELLVERVVGRRADPETGIIYHMKYKPAETPEIAARLVQRSDDTEEAIMVRVKNFHDNVASIIDAYQPQLLKVDGTSKPDEVWAHLKLTLDTVCIKGSPNNDSKSDVEDTFAMIKPGTANIFYQEIKDVIALNGFEVITECRTKLSREQAKKFYVEHEGKAFYESLVDYMCSGVVVALHLRRDSAISAWRHLIGPTNYIKAKMDRPDSIRGTFATDGQKNACHGSDSVASAQRELSFWFSVGGFDTSGPYMSPLGGANQSMPKVSVMPQSPVRKTPPGFEAPKRYSSKARTVPSISNADLGLMEAYANYDVEPVLKMLLQKLMVERPADVTGFALNALATMHQESGKAIPDFPLVASKLQPGMLGEVKDGGLSPRGSGEPLPSIKAEDDSSSITAVNND